MASKILYRLKNSNKIKWNSNNSNSNRISYLSSGSNTSLLFTNNNNKNIQQERNMSFFRDAYSNFKHLVKNDPEYEQILSEFDKTFLNSYFENKRVKAEKDAAEKEEKLAKEAARMQEEMQKLQEHRDKMTQEEIEALREKQRKLYEDMVNKREGKQSTKKGKKETKGKAHAMDPDKVDDFETTNILKAKFDEAAGNRPLPFDILREDQTFEECQDYSSVLNSLTQDDAVLQEAEKDQVLQAEELDAYRTMVLEAYAHCQSQGIKVDAVDISKLEKEDFYELPIPIISYCEEKLLIFDEVRPDENPEQTSKLDDEKQNQPFRLPGKPNEVHHFEPPLHIKAIDKVTNIVEIAIPPLTRTNALFAIMGGHEPTLKKVFSDNEELLMPGINFERFKSDCIKFLIPEYLYHFFQGNLFEVKSLTSDECYQKSKSIVNTMEGQYKILCCDIRKSKVEFFTPVIFDDVIAFSFKTTTYHTIGFRDYSGKLIKDENFKDLQDQLYMTRVNVVISGEPDKNKMGWVVSNIQLAGPPYPLPEHFPIDEDD